jgi:uncharacterized protein (UPF0333 family)
MKITFKKLSQKGMLSLHVLLPALLVIASIGGIGAYVLQKSKAASPVSCVSPNRSVYKGSTIVVKMTCTNWTSSKMYIYPNPKIRAESNFGTQYSSTGSALNLAPRQTLTGYYTFKVPTTLKSGTNTVWITSSFYTGGNSGTYGCGATTKWTII